MVTSLWLTIAGGSTDEVVEAVHILGRPSNGIVLPVENACGHEGVIVRSNGVKAVMD